MANSLNRPADCQELVWYFAYGSNMLSDKFVKGRGIQPLKRANVRTPGYVLGLDIPGMPYAEPTFTSLLSRDEADLAVNSQPDAIGVAYLLTQAQWIRVIGSEGGGIAYTEIQVQAEPISVADAHQTGGSITVHTLTSILRRRPWPRPSARYMKIITDGAAEADLPVDYQMYLQDIAIYEPPRSKRGRAGAAVFLSFWGPVMGIMEKITNATIGDDGHCPLFVLWLVRATMLLIWFTHDIMFAPLIGRGDGYEPQACATTEDVRNEKSPLLEKTEMVMYDTV